MNAPIKDGGPAFPYQRDHVLYSRDDPTKPVQTIKGVWTGGMTLRDYFAAKAMASFILASNGKTFGDSEDGMKTCATTAYVAYAMAAAMLAAREAQS